MESLIAGIVCKMYDDLQDNPLLKKYRNKILMESLKIIHVMLFTIISLKDSTFYYFFFVSILLNALSNPSGYTQPYERSILLVCPLLFFFMKSPTSISKIEILFILLFLSTNCVESLYSQEEYSYVKCIIRLYFCFLATLFYYLSTSTTLHYLMAYFIGYFALSFIIQLYSVTKLKQKRKHSSFLWLNKCLASLDDWLESRFMKSKTNRKTIHYTNK